MRYAVIILASTTAYFFMSYIFAMIRLGKAEDLVRHQSLWFGKMRDFVFEYGKFPDSDGHADEDYHSQDVEAHWNYYHAIVDKFNKPPEDSDEEG